MDRRSDYAYTVNQNIRGENMGLEFLQTDDDIEEFVSHLYDQGLLLSYRRKAMQHILLDRDAAIHALQYDLYTKGSGYYLSDAGNSPLLILDSCEEQSHPSKLGRQGRMAGLICHIDKNNPKEKELMRQLRNYFRRNYKFLRYNGETRMSCHFGPHYQQMEADFFADPRAEDLCVGYLCLICHPEQAEMEKERAADALKRLDIQNVQISMRPYWCNPSLIQLHIPFLYYTPSFSVESYSSVFSELSFNGEIRFSSSNFRFSFQNVASPDALVEQEKTNYVKVLLQRPW